MAKTVNFTLTDREQQAADWLQYELSIPTTAGLLRHLLADRAKQLKCPHLANPTGLPAKPRTPTREEIWANPELNPKPVVIGFIGANGGAVPDRVVTMADGRNYGCDEDGLPSGPPLPPEIYGDAPPSAPPAPTAFNNLSPQLQARIAERMRKTVAPPAANAANGYDRLEELFGDDEP